MNGRLGFGVFLAPHHPTDRDARSSEPRNAMLGVGPGALPSDAFMLRIDPMTQRDHMHEGLRVILRLLHERSRSRWTVHGTGCSLGRKISEDSGRVRRRSTSNLLVEVARSFV
jgi:hypothetical protein